MDKANTVSPDGTCKILNSDVPAVFAEIVASPSTAELAAAELVCRDEEALEPMIKTTTAVS